MRWRAFASRATGRRLFAPEVVQTSTMDCGPAALTCLLEGFGIPVSYARLQEACQTDLDGTSINTIERVAVSLGLDAEQIMIPADHLFVSAALAFVASALAASTRPVYMWLMSNVPSNLRGTVMGVTATSNQSGIILGSAIGGLLLSAGYHWLGWFALAACVIGAGVARVIGEPVPHEG